MSTPTSTQKASDGKGSSKNPLVAKRAKSIAATKPSFKPYQGPQFFICIACKARYCGPKHITNPKLCPLCDPGVDQRVLKPQVHVNYF